MILSTLYETHTGIYNHLNPANKRPLANVAFFEAEDYNKNSQLEQAIATFAKRNIKEVFGINLLEYLNLPSDICAMLTQTAIKELENKNSTLSDIEKELKI